MNCQSRGISSRYKMQDEDIYHIDKTTNWSGMSPGLSSFLSRCSGNSVGSVPPNLCLSAPPDSPSSVPQDWNRGHSCDSHYTKLAQGDMVLEHIPTLHAPFQIESPISENNPLSCFLLFGINSMAIKGQGLTRLCCPFSHEGLVVNLLENLPSHQKILFFPWWEVMKFHSRKYSVGYTLARIQPRIFVWA